MCRDTVQTGGGLLGAGGGERREWLLKALGFLFAVAEIR